jgi:putative transposase
MGDMPRKAREKHSEAIYHIMCRSISEILLFRDEEDKDYYLVLVKRFNEKYKCKTYAYCLMDSHVHFEFDPQGFDVSKYMLCLNTAYVSYYNKKYQRHGHLFQGRFESKIIDSDQYALTLSAYIHNNPHDIEGFSGREEEYKYSSYGIYLGIRKDTHRLIDKGFTMALFNIRDYNKFREKYFEFVSHQRDVGSFKELKKKFATLVENEYISGRKVIARDLSPAKVISYLSEKLMISGKAAIMIKGDRRNREYRAFNAYVLRALCGLGYKEICNNLHNITISGCSKLCRRGYELCKDEGSEYLKLFDELTSCNC